MSSVSVQFGCLRKKKRENGAAIPTCYTVKCQSVDIQARSPSHAITQAWWTLLTDERRRKKLCPRLSKTPIIMSVASCAWSYFCSARLILLQKNLQIVKRKWVWNCISWDATRGAWTTQEIWKDRRPKIQFECNLVLLLCWYFGHKISLLRDSKPILWQWPNSAISVRRGTRTFPPQTFLFQKPLQWTHCSK